jgi:hypothetical protein
LNCDASANNAAPPCPDPSASIAASSPRTSIARTGAGLHTPAPPAPRLVGQVPQEQHTHRAPQADVQFARTTSGCLRLSCG